MRKNKLYFFLSILTIIFLFSFAALCNQCGTAAEEEKIGVGEEEEAAAEEEAAVKIPEGWKQFTGSGFELYLPEKWEGGSKEELDSVVEELKDIGQDQLVSQVEANMPYILFWAYDSETIAAGGNVNNLNIMIESDGLSLDEYMNLSYENVAEMYEQAGYTFSILEQSIVSLGNYEEVGRTIVEQTVEGVKTKAAQYMIKSDSDFWVLTFTTGLEDFDQNIQTFDNTVETFKIIE